ncbi:cobyric acid synthase [Nitrospira sp.]|nr:cobyric acid synthase [Nitrospira sp.]
MSLNSFVTHEGGEIGRAQAVQALACGLLPSVHMNPILLKPESDTRAQVIVQGIPRYTREASDFRTFQVELWDAITDSYRRMSESSDLVIIEGAGSAAEVNLRDRDLVNWRMVEHADAKVILVADIERGGVFAQIVGTLELLTPNERARVLGVVINKFRGDPALFHDGISFLRDRTGVPILGVVPYLFECRFEPEDGLPAAAGRPVAFTRDSVNIGVLLLPWMSNVTDFLPLEAEPDVALRYIRTPRELVGADVVILPGTKNTLSDLAYLRERRFPAPLVAHVDGGGELVGVCGGYQMLGNSLSDPEALEHGGHSAGLGFLDADTVWQSPKICRQVAGEIIGLETLGGYAISGYQIHMGRTTTGAGACVRIMSQVANSGEVDGACVTLFSEGAVGHGSRVWGTTVHGLFDAPLFRRAWLNRIRLRKGLQLLEADTSVAVSSVLERTVHRWAEHLERYVDLTAIERALCLEVIP